MRRGSNRRATANQQAPAEKATLGSGYGEGWLRRLVANCWKHKTLSLVAFGASLIATLVTTAIPLIQRYIIDDAILTHKDPIWPGATLLIVMAAISFGAVYLRRYRGGQLSLDVQHDLRTELFGSLTKLDGARQDQLHTGQIVSRSISDLNMIQSLLSMMPMLIGNALLFVLSIGVMFWLSPTLALISLAVGPALLVLSIASRRRLFPASWDAQQKAGEVAGVVEGAVTGVRVVKGFGQEEQEIERLEGIGRILYAARVRTVKMMARFSPALGAIPALGQVGVLALGGYMAIKGEITLGTFLAFAAYLAQMVNPVRALTNLITIGQEARASVIRVYEVIDSRPVLSEKPDAIVLPAGSNEVELDDVHFGYVPSEPVLRGLSLRVRPGETLALVGTSGSGKSTVSLLLPRFYDVTSGAIRVGIHDVRDLTIDSLRASIGLVLEESFLFSDTVRNNIAYGRPDATQEQVVAAARAAEAEEFILGLPDGYDTVVGEQGLTLSGGQRQRVALARALITDPSILILDDATSAIDARVEAQIHATLRKVMAGRTTLLIAHRRSTLELADQIAVIDEGRLVDQGTHEELTARCPEYRLLLAGPGDDAEGTDAGEISYYRNEAATTAAACRAAPAPGGITPALWPAAKRAAASGTGGTGTGGTGAGSDAASKQLATTAAAGIGRGHVSGGGMAGGRGGGASQRGAALSGGAMGGGWMAGVPASPELLAKVAALPPANEDPGVDEQFARAPDPRFTLRKLLRPFAIALGIGLLLDALDAVASTVMPLLVRNGIDNGVEKTMLSFQARLDSILAVSAIGLAIVLGDWAVNWAQTIVVGRNGERLLYTLRVKIFSHLQRLGLDFYERELTGRIMTRMTTDVDALSSFFQTGLITMVNSVLTFRRRADPDAGHQRAARAHSLPVPAVPHRGDDHLPAQVVPRVHRGQGEGQRRQRRPAGERRRAPGSPGLPARAGELGPVRGPVRRLPEVAAAGAADDRRVLPVRAGALDDRRRGDPVRGRQPGPQQHADRRQPDRLSALGGPALLAHPADVPGVRRLSAGQRRPAADQGPAADAHQHAACGQPGPAGPAARPDRAARCAVRLRRAAGPGHPRGRPDDRARRDRGAGRADRRRKVDAGQAHRTVL